MVVFNLNENHIQQGDGLLDYFTASKYDGEHHAYSLNPKTFMQPHSFTGPGTQYKLREQLHDDIELNDLDGYSKSHDKVYMDEKDAYQHDHDKSKHMNNIWKADEEYIQKAKYSHDEPILGPIASKMIETKMNLEKAHVLPTKMFSGMGKEKEKEEESDLDPCYKLRELVNSSYKLKDKKENKHKINKSQSGGLHPVIIPVITALITSLAPKIYDTIKAKIQGNKQEGKGMPILKTNKEKQNYVFKILKLL